MAGHIRGITVTLYDKTQVGTDILNKPIYTETAVRVDNVLVAPATHEENLDTIDLYDRGAVYTLAIPKGDTHDWTDKRVSFFGEDWHTFGIPLEGIECDIPLDWNKKVMVERYE